jgi:hypothetical protein
MQDKETFSNGDAIASESDYAAAHALLSRKASAPFLLRRVMSHFEAYRAARKYGWSRPWNKGGLRTFLTLEFHASADLEYARLARSWASLAGARDVSLLDTLASAAGARCFVFLHERDDAHGIFEGFTLSFGMPSSAGRRFRDRYDVIVERPLGEPSEKVMVRVFEDRFVAGREVTGPFPPAKELTASFTAADDGVVGLLGVSLDLVRRDAFDTARHWTHWTQDVIDYFGPRAHPEAARWFGVGAFALAHAERFPAQLRAAGGANTASQGRRSA